MRGDWKSEAGGHALRFVVSLLLLAQVHLAVGELSDLPFFVSAVSIAAFLGYAFASAGFRTWVAMAALCAAPFAARSAVGLLSLISKYESITADSALLIFDRNMLVTAAPFYWAGATAFFAKASPRFFRSEPLLNGVALAVFFALIDARTLAAYEKPIVLACVVVGIVFLEFVILASSVPVEVRASGRERVGTALALAAVCLLAVFLLLKPFEERAAKEGGGLIKPSLFKFDFSQYLRLESEISLSEDLVLIVRKDAEDRHTLVRRFVLSEYDKRRGFFRKEGLDDRVHPISLPDTRMKLDEKTYKRTKELDQEYYLVNFDASALLAFNQPTEVIPYKSWDSSSFTSVYAAKSRVSDVLPFELIDSADRNGTEKVRRILGDSEYATLTNYGNDERIQKLAQEITKGSSGYWDNVQAVFEKLKYGDYRYSLKPGLASDGDQLGRFLFDARKGYCSYFAFSMTLLLRSLGIPARTAVGFFIDPASAVFGYYPVRSDMAHAWVEVFFPDYGWIEYDPTTEQLAAGEDFQFSSGVPPDQFEKLMKEILANRERLEAHGAEKSSSIADAVPRLVGAVTKFARERWALLLALAWLGLSVYRRGFLFVRSRLSRDPRTRARLLAAHALRRLESAGWRRGRDESLGEFAARADAALDSGFSAVFSFGERALFAAEFTRSDAEALESAYRVFSSRCVRRIPTRRRLAAWLVPFRVFRPRSATAALLICICIAIPGDPVNAQRSAGDVSSASELLAQIDELIAGERWEKAVELLRAGETRYPKDVRFPSALGDLFAERKLYGLAWDEYRAAEKIDGNDPTLLHRLATTAGKLNKDDFSAIYLERVVTLRPDDRDAVGDLAWMYFKLHRLREGERFLLDAVSRLGQDPGFSMTLGTIYSDLYDYASSKKWYEEAIADAKRNKARTFEAVAQYNLSILESKFYHYAEAFKRTGLSLESADRPSGHLARGELYLKRLDFMKTYAEYQRAYDLDVSPLSKLNFADAYLSAGRLAEARSYAEKALSVTDLSWMFNYGTNLHQYKRDVHDILSEAYDGLANLEASYPRAGIMESAGSFVRVISYRFKAAGHRALFHEYARKSAASYSAGGQPLNAAMNYYDAFADYPSRALPYLKEAQEIERTLVPDSVGLYELERGRMERSARRIESAIRSFDPIWQKDLSAKAYAELAKLYPARSAESRDAAERLFALNRGALRQHAILLPIALSITDDGGKKSAALRRVLTKSGFSVVQNEVPVRYALELRVEGAEVRCVLKDTLRGTLVVNRGFKLPSASGADLAAFGRAVSDAVFAAN